MILRERLALWLSRHDRVRQTLTVMIGMHALCALAMAAAPSAAAATGAAALGWTGLRDADGVPLKDMFLSVVSTSEAVTNNGQEVDWNPASWLQWLNEAGQVWMSHSLVTSVLTWEAAGIVYGAALSFWFLRFAMSNTYLLALSEVARPIHTAVTGFVNAMWLGPIAIALCVLVAGFHYQNGRPGRAWSIAGNAAILTLLLFTFFRNPIEELTSEHGLLGMARSTGFQIAQTVRGQSFAPGQSLDGQLDAMMGELISNTVRPMIQLMNFGRVVDDIPGCKQAWSAAVRAADGQGPGPAHAMYADPRLPQTGGIHCNAADALAHAQHLGANDIMLGALFLGIGFFIGFFIWYVGISTLVVGAKAAYYGIIVTPAFLLGMIGWKRAKDFATRSGSQLLFHGVETIIFTTFLAISTLGIAWTLTTGIIGRGEATVVPRLLMVAIGSIVAVFLFHYIDKHFYTDNVGTIAHHWRSVWDSGRSAARSEYDDFHDGLDRARGLRDRYRNWRSGSSDEDGEESTETGGGSKPDDVPGLDVVKPRPSRPAPDLATKPAASAGTEEVAAHATSAAATTATRSAATAEVGAAAETVAEVAAPEVAVPVAATVAVVERVRGHHRDETGAAHESGGGHPHGSHPHVEPSTQHSPFDEPAIGTPEPGLAMATTSAQRPARRASAARHAASAGDDDPSQRSPGNAADDASDDGPLEFPAATPRPATKGQQ